MAVLIPLITTESLGTFERIVRFFRVGDL